MARAFAGSLAAIGFADLTGSSPARGPVRTNQRAVLQPVDVTWLVRGAVIIPAALLLAPSYRLLWQLGLLNSYAGLILPALAPAFGVFHFRQAMLNTVPSELPEAARIDGAGELRIVFTIVTLFLKIFLSQSALSSDTEFTGQRSRNQSHEPV